MILLKLFVSYPFFSSIADCGRESIGVSRVALPRTAVAFPYVISALEGLLLCHACAGYRTRNGLAFSGTVASYDGVVRRLVRMYSVRRGEAIYQAWWRLESKMTDPQGSQFVKAKSTEYWYVQNCHSQEQRYGVYAYPRYGVYACPLRYYPASTPMTDGRRMTRL